MVNKNRCLLTGGAGFIGQAISAELKHRGDDVVILDQKCDNVLGLGVNRGNILDQNLLISLCSDIDEIYHLAALLGTSELIERPFEGIEVNVRGTLNALEASRINRVSRFFYPGMPRIWLNMYSITKASAEDICRLYQKYYGVNTRILRWSNAYGPGQHIYPIRKVVPIFIIQALYNLPIEIWGDGTQSVDLLYVEDLAKWTIDFMRKDDIPDYTIEIGAYHTCTVNGLAALIIELTQSNSSVVHLPMRWGEDIGVTVPRLTSLSHILNMPIEPTPLRAGLKKTIGYYSKLDTNIHERAIRYYYGCNLKDIVPYMITTEAKAYKMNQRSKNSSQNVAYTKSQLDKKERQKKYAK